MKERKNSSKRDTKHGFIKSTAHFGCMGVGGGGERKIHAVGATPELQIPYVRRPMMGKEIRCNGYRSVSDKWRHWRTDEQTSTEPGGIETIVEYCQCPGTSTTVCASRPKNKTKKRDPTKTKHGYRITKIHHKLFVKLLICCINRDKMHLSSCLAPLSVSLALTPPYSESLFLLLNVLGFS